MQPQATDYSVYELSAAEWIKYGIIGILLAGVAAYIFYRSAIIFIILAVPAAVLYPIYKRQELFDARKRKLSAEFREGITVLASALSAGYSLENAMTESTEELTVLYGENSLIVKEFEYIDHRVSMNIPIELAWQEFADRSGIDDIRNFAQVLKVAKRSGGELNTIIMRTADTIGDKIQIKEEILTQTSAKVFEQKVMSVIPVVIVIYIEITSPGFFDVMYDGIVGRIVMTGCLITYIAAIWLGNKILEIEI
ncbi:MAG: type II secretion system F family protein [Lachnospiraceae bacterium]|nr:type II secretion system F family protein [Lachnospiraceae bacterium]